MYFLKGKKGRRMVSLWFCTRVRRSRTSWEVTKATGLVSCDFAPNSEEITYLLRGDKGHGMVSLWFCTAVGRSRTPWEVTTATGWSVYDFSPQWGKDILAERQQRPRDGQFVILHPSEEITYSLRGHNGRRMVSLWFCTPMRRSRTSLRGDKGHGMQITNLTILRPLWPLSEYVISSLGCKNHKLTIPWPLLPLSEYVFSSLRWKIINWPSRGRCHLSGSTWSPHCGAKS